MHHPFGKEETASQKELFGFFCECLRRGEWELAQACVPQLHAAQGDVPKKVEDILRALVACPHQLRYGVSLPARQSRGKGTQGSGFGLGSMGLTQLTP